MPARNDLEEAKEEEAEAIVKDGIAAPVGLDSIFFGVAQT